MGSRAPTALDIVMWYMEKKTPVECLCALDRQVLGPTYQGIDATAGMIMFSGRQRLSSQHILALPVTWPGRSTASRSRSTAPTVCSPSTTPRDMCCRLQAATRGLQSDTSRLVDFMGSYPPGDMALGELRGPMREETDSWLNRMALGVPTQPAQPRSASQPDADQGLDLSAG